MILNYINLQKFVLVAVCDDMMVDLHTRLYLVFVIVSNFPYDSKLDVIIDKRAET